MNIKFLLIVFFIFYGEIIFAENDDWTSYGKDSGGGHYSKASEITPDNVHLLEKHGFIGLVIIKVEQILEVRYTRNSNIFSSYPLLVK